ncbi:MAG: hypothetical protein CMF55_00540 [Legionellales bacterium]|nr:hypothetical protein [Legionellales bacterium]|tara:strand:- start:166 stop:474 length:309 start_codon:yes stop_codon:yes gene_type:complete
MRTGTYLRIKYFEEIETLWSFSRTEGVNKFTLNLMGRCAYNALYMHAREQGYTEKEAIEICASKWPRHNEEQLTEIFFIGFKDFLSPDDNISLKDYAGVEQA